MGRMIAYAPNIVISSTFLLIYLTVSSSCVPEVPVAGFQLNGQAVMDSYLIPADEHALDISKSFSACLWFRLHYINGAAAQTSSSLMSSVMESTATNSFLITMDTDDGEKFVLRATLDVDRDHVLRTKINLTGHFHLLEWHHTCAIFRKEASDASLTLIVDGKFNQSASTSEFQDPKLPSTPIALYIAQEQDGYKDTEDFDLIQSFSGEISELGFYRDALDVAAIQSLASCQSGVSDMPAQLRIFGSFNGTDYIQVNVSWSHMPLSHFCQPDPLKDHLLWLWPTSFSAFRPLCELVNGRLPAADTGPAFVSLIEQKAELFSRVRDPTLPKKMREEVAILTGVKWDGHKDRFYNMYTGTVFDDAFSTRSNFNHNLRGPNESIVGYWFKTFDTFPDSFLFGKGLCHIQGRNRLRIRGLCKMVQIEGNGVIDTEYYIHGTSYGMPWFRGFRRSEVKYDFLEHDAWVIQATHNPIPYKRIAYTDPLPIGRKLWLTPKDFCGRGEMERNITLTICTDYEYTCDSGECIEISKRCDNQINCKDMSDEVDCSYIRFDRTYNKYVSPTGHAHTPVNVNVEFTIQDVPYIDTFNLKFTVNFFIEMSWKDSRLEYNNLNDHDLSNQLSLTDRESIWIPKLIFLNSLGAAQTFVDDDSTSYIKKSGKPYLAPLQEEREALIFSGQDSKIVTSREYYNEFTCAYKLKYYPFDTQVCRMNFEASAKIGDSIALSGSEENSMVQFLSHKDKIEYEIARIVSEFNVRPGNNFSQASVIIQFRRKMEYHVFNTILQTFFLKAIGLLTLFFDIHNFSDRIMVTLTTMLVIATISTSIQENLPKTSYYKLMDYWLLFCFNILIFTLIIHTIIARILLKRDKVVPQIRVNMHSQASSNSENAEGLANRVNFTGQILYVIISIGFHAIFWYIAIREYTKYI